MKTSIRHSLHKNIERFELYCFRFLRKISYRLCRRPKQKKRSKMRERKKKLLPKKYWFSCKIYLKFTQTNCAKVKMTEIEQKKNAIKFSRFFFFEQFFIVILLFELRNKRSIEKNLPKHLFVFRFVFMLKNWFG